MNSFYKQGEYSNCLSLYHEFKHRFPESALINNTLGWAVYQSCLKDHDFDRGNNGIFLKQVAYVIARTEDTMYSPLWRVIALVVKAFFDKKLPELDKEKAVQYLDLVNPDNLSEQERSFPANGRMVRLASDREKWYAAKSKLCLAVKDYAGCISVCDTALRVLSSFHNNNDVWFRYRKALAYCSLGDLDQTEKEITEALAIGIDHWCLYQLLFAVAVKKGDRDKAVVYAGTCALSDREHKMRVRFYDRVAVELSDQGLLHEAGLHHRLAALLREENNWKQPETAEMPLDEPIKFLDKAAVLKELLPIWQSWRDRDKVFLSGTVCRIFPSGRDGLIADEDDKQYYFRFGDVSGKREQIAEGTAVRFALTERFNKKKGQLQQNATDISLV